MMQLSRCVLKPAIGVLFAALLPVTLRAQCFNDPGKHTCFEYTGLEVRNRFILFGWEAREFATASLNPNVYSQVGNRVNGHLWTQVTLIADDPNYVYEPTCDNPQADGRCVGTYKFAAKFYNPYGQTERWVGSNENMATVAFPRCESGRSFWWKGRVKIESVEKSLPWDPETVVNLQPFYSFSPIKFTTPLRTGTTSCEAYENAWQAYDGFVDVTWDADIQRLVVPYANFWKNHSFWERGWQTLVTIGNQTGSTQNYYIENHLYGGDHGGHGQGPCSANNEDEIEVLVKLAAGQEQKTDAFRFHVADDVLTVHDTVLFIRTAEPPRGGTQASVRVFPNPSGTSICP